MATFGRRGENAPNAALTNAQAAQARLRFATGTVRISALAREYGCSYWVMWRIVHHQTYLAPDKYYLKRD